MTWDELLGVVGMIAVAAPGAAFAAIGIPSLLGVRLSERTTSLCTRFATWTGLFCVVAVAVGLVLAGRAAVAFDAGQAVSFGGHEAEGEHFHFGVKFVFDRLSAPMLLLSYVLCGVIAAFARAYLHRETGFVRFFALLAMFLFGMTLSAAAGTIEVLFAGWEVVGLSSALLVAFFHERSGPVRNGQRIWSVYRIADGAFLLGAVALHHMTGGGELDRMAGAAAWPGGAADVTSWQAFFAGSLLLIAAAGKSALVPFSGWLPRAMEGPTPSSAVFYGALSVHLGAYLLLRVSPLIEASTPLMIAVIALGGATAACAASAGRSQTDVKAQLCFASLTQVGIIVVEIGLGFRYLALAHLIGHACLRTLQFLRAPSAISDAVAVENAVGEKLGLAGSVSRRRFPQAVELWLYRFSLERGFFDTVLDRFVASPFVSLFRFFDLAERRWTEFLSGSPARESDAARPTFESHEYLP